MKKIVSMILVIVMIASLALGLTACGEGKDGVTPQLRINPDTNFWEVSYDEGATWVSMEVKATGADGKDGVDGTNGKDGADGKDGKDGVSITNSTINCNDNDPTAGESFAALCLNKDAINGKITANWTINSYKLIVKPNGGTWAEKTEDQEFTQDYNTTKDIADPTRVGYTFTEWTLEGAGTFADKVYTFGADNGTLTAQWTINQYTIIFDTAGGSAIASITKDFGSAITKPSDPTKVGYSFAGWDKDVPATMPAENMTITAKWRINQYTITFDTAGGSDIASITQDFDTAITKPKNQT